MQPSEPNEKELLKEILQPLLDDFQYWFSRSRSLLESERLSFLSPDEQTNLLERIKQSEEEVKTASMLFKITQGQAGIDTKVVGSWHQLVGQCWRIANQWRYLKNQTGR
jgi:hypothetical protein